jgi:hypothetical protein
MKGRARVVRKVVDTNYLQIPHLREYLARSPCHLVVLTDIVAIEACKTNAAVVLPLSMKALSEFPRQVLILKESAKIIEMSGRPAGLTKRMIDHRQTGTFGAFCADLHAANEGDPVQQARLRERERFAASKISHLVNSSAELIGHFQAAAAAFSEKELAEIRARRPYSQTTQKKLIENVIIFAEMIRESLNARQPDNKGEAVNSFIFRYALCIVLLITRWVSYGAPAERKPAKIVNDIMDMHLAAYSTYFNGLLSNDANLISVYREARYVLSAIGGAVG